LSPKLQTRDIPGQHVTFEIHRSPDGKLAALNIRPMGEDFDCPDPGKGVGKGTREEEDQSLDWACTSCGERNFVKRFECFRCKRARPPGFSDPRPGEATEPRRTVSPHAGSRAWRELYAGEGSKGSDSSRSRGRRHRKRKKVKRKKKSKRSHSSSSNSSSSDRSRRSKRKRGARHSSSDSSRSSSSKSSDCEMEEPRRATKHPAGFAKQCGEVEQAKAQALEELMRLQHIATKEARMTEFRALLRKWHPDKNPDRVDVATAVFQFLQKGKPMLDARS